jgi:hypothetical protein
MHPLVPTLAAAIILLLCLPYSPALAQTTYDVTVGSKTENHPFSGQGWPEAYYIDGQESPELTLQRGVTYTFQMNNVDAMHPFYITSTQSGGGGQIWSDGVAGNFATGNASVVFNVPNTAPDVLWYQCGTHLLMGYRLNIVGGTAGEPGAAPLAFAVTSAGPNPATDRLMLRVDLPGDAEVSLSIYDMLGRRVAREALGVLQAGAGLTVGIWVDGLAPGAYVYRLDAVAASGAMSASDTFVKEG